MDISIQPRDNLMESYISGRSCSLLTWLGLGLDGGLSLLLWAGVLHGDSRIRDRFRRLGRLRLWDRQVSSRALATDRI